MQILPVIHFLDRNLAVEQSAIAKDNGAAGVFLISHHGNDAELVEVAADIKLANVDFQVGINLLSMSPLRAAELAYGCNLDMVWADDMGVDSRGLTQEGVLLSSFAKAHPKFKMFASVAFKYRPHEPNPGFAALKALEAGFIPTTSGEATGSAPEIFKIREMSSATNGNLAIASGMTPDNVGTYAKYLSYILVATGISIDDYRIDPDKLKRLIEIARNRSIPAP